MRSINGIQSIKAFLFDMNTQVLNREILNSWLPNIDVLVAKKNYSTLVEVNAKTGPLFKVV